MKGFDIYEYRKEEINRYENQRKEWCDLVETMEDKHREFY